MLEILAYAPAAAFLTWVFLYGIGYDRPRSPITHAEILRFRRNLDEYNGPVE